MPEAMARQMEAYHRLRPEIVAQNNHGWALIAGERFIKLFDDYADAAIYADENFPTEDVLIRHTSEHRGIAPFVVSRG